MGAGRPKGSKDRHPRRHSLRVIPIGACLPGGKEPLEYMLAVMNDTTADLARRDRMAIASAPYRHAKVTADVEKEPYVGKKQARLDSAETAGQGTEWGDDLRSEVGEVAHH